MRRVTPRATIESVGLWVLFWLALVALALQRIFAYDVWWQIAAGEWIAGHGLPDRDPFSFGFPERTWIEPRWSWCLLVRAVAGGLGLEFLVLLEVGLLALAFWLIGRIRPDAPAWIRVLGLTVALACMHERFAVRPELVSFVLLGLFLLCLERYRAGRSAAWLAVLPVAQIVWSNAHTLWVLGPALLWIVVGAELLDGVVTRRPGRIAGQRLARLIAVAAATTLAALVNPYFLRGALFPFELLAEIRPGHLFDEAIGEFRGPLSPGLLGLNFRTAVGVAALAISGCSFLASGRAAPASRIALWAAFFLLYLEAQRNVALFGIVAGWVTLANLADRGPAPGRWRAATAAALAVLLAATIPLAATDRLYRWQGSLKQFGSGVSDRRFPVRALAFLRGSGIQGPVLHALGDGGYVLHEGGARSAYVDGRLEVYGAEILERALRLTSTGEGLDAEARRTGATSVLVPNEDRYRGLLAALEASRGWVPVYFDPLHVVYLRRTPATRALAARLRIDWSAPAEHDVARPREIAAAEWIPAWWPRAPDAFAEERLGSLLLAVGSYDRALARFEAAVLADPANRAARLHLALFRRAQRRDAEAERLLAGLPAAVRDGLDVELLSAQLQLWAARPADAAAHFERALALGAREPATSLRLARAEIRAGWIDRAGERLERIAREHPDEADASNLLAVVALERGDHRAAIAHFERSLRADPDQPGVCRSLARLYAAAGDGGRARELEARAAEIEAR